MSQSVARLKELLFDTEAQALDDLARRIEALARIDQAGRDELCVRIDAVFDRAGSSERLASSVSEILSTALRKAEVADHAQLAEAIAPLVVKTIRTELRNSQDEMVEALYPITGRLVKAYVASAMKDLAADVNRRVELNPLMLRLQSLFSGRSVAELALASTQRFEVEDVLLIRRGSGELLARWPDTSVAAGHGAMSGVLAAINEFANDAFAADESSLRQIEFGDQTVYLRASPLYLLAARCSGTAPPSIETSIDETFLAAIERRNALDDDVTIARDGSDASQRSLVDIGKSLHGELAAISAKSQRSFGGSIVKFLAFLILMPLLWWATYTTGARYNEGMVRRTALDVTASVGDMRGYPTKIEVGPIGRTLTVSGLAPRDDVKARVVERLKVALPETTLIDQLTVVPGSGKPAPDLTDELSAVRREVSSIDDAVTAEAVRRDISRSSQALSQAADDLGRAKIAARQDFDAAKTEKAAQDLATLAREVANLAASYATAGEQEWMTNAAGIGAQIHDVNRSIMQAAGSTDTESQGNSDARAATRSAAVVELGREAERAAGLAAAFALAARLQPPPAPPPLQVVAAPEISPRQRLVDFIRSKAIFFADGVDYRQADAVQPMLRQLADLIRDGGTLVRVIGYTDEAGQPTTNVPLAEQRAQRVAQDLLALGVPANLLAAVGRESGLRISNLQGPTSPNRRVEFEIGFDGEQPQ